jgi:hypothetical protein
VPADEVDQLYNIRPYYLAPEGEVASQPFAVIREAIKKQGMVALARVVLTNREHVIANGSQKFISLEASVAPPATVIELLKSAPSTAALSYGSGAIRRARPPAAASAAGNRTRSRHATAVRHRKQRPCLAAFALLAGMARGPDSRSGRSSDETWDDNIEDGLMTGKKTAAKAEPKTVVADDPDDRKGRLKKSGNSRPSVSRKSAPFSRT